MSYTAKLALSKLLAAKAKLALKSSKQTITYRTTVPAGECLRNELPSGLFLLQKSSKYRLPFSISRPHEISEKKFYKNHVTEAVFSPRRISEKKK